MTFTLSQNDSAWDSSLFFLCLFRNPLSLQCHDASSPMGILLSVQSSSGPIRSHLVGKGKWEKRMKAPLPYSFGRKWFTSHLEFSAMGIFTVKRERDLFTSLHYNLSDQMGSHFLLLFSLCLLLWSISNVSVAKKHIARKCRYFILIDWTLYNSFHIFCLKT